MSEEGGSSSDVSGYPLTGATGHSSSASDSIDIDSDILSQILRDVANESSIGASEPVCQEQKILRDVANESSIGASEPVCQEQKILRDVANESSIGASESVCQENSMQDHRAPVPRKTTLLTNPTTSADLPSVDLVSKAITPTPPISTSTGITPIPMPATTSSTSLNSGITTPAAGLSVSKSFSNNHDSSFSPSMMSPISLKPAATSYQQEQQSEVVSTSDLMEFGELANHILKPSPTPITTFASNTFDTSPSTMSRVNQPKSGVALARMTPSEHDYLPSHPSATPTAQINLPSTPTSESPSSTCRATTLCNTASSFDSPKTSPIQRTTTSSGVSYSVTKVREEILLSNSNRIQQPHLPLSNLSSPSIHNIRPLSTSTPVKPIMSIPNVTRIQPLLSTCASPIAKPAQQIPVPSNRLLQHSNSNVVSQHQLTNRSIHSIPMTPRSTPITPRKLCTTDAPASISSIVSTQSSNKTALNQLCSARDAALSLNKISTVVPVPNKPIIDKKIVETAIKNQSAQLVEPSSMDNNTTPSQSVGHTQSSTTTTTTTTTANTVKATVIPASSIRVLSSQGIRKIPMLITPTIPAVIPSTISAVSTPAKTAIQAIPNITTPKSLFKCNPSVGSRKSQSPQITTPLVKLRESVIPSTTTAIINSTLPTHSARLIKATSMTGPKDKIDTDDTMPLVGNSQINRKLSDSSQCENLSKDDSSKSISTISANSSTTTFSSP